MSSPLSAFTAIPNPQMPAFLGAQSFIMMYQAGEGWQYGKRRISALSNEEFNKLDVKQLMERQAMELKGALPIIERSMNNMTRMVPMIIEQYGDFIREAIKAMPEAIGNIFSQSGSQGGSDIFGVRYDTGQGTRYNPQQQASDATLGKWLREQGYNPGSNPFPNYTPQRTGEQDRRNRELEARRRGQPLQVTTPPIPTQLQTGIRPGSVRKKAGQSQINERLRLIRLIKQWGDSLKKMKAFWDNRKISSAQWNQSKGQYTGLLKRDQTKLMTLIQRYRF